MYVPFMLIVGGVLPWQPEKVLKPIVAFEPKTYFLFQFECLTSYNYTPNQVTYL